MRIHNDYPVGKEGCKLLGDKGGLEIKFPYGYDIGVPGVTHLHGLWDAAVGIYPPNLQRSTFTEGDLPETWKRELVCPNLYFYRGVLKFTGKCLKILGKPR